MSDKNGLIANSGAEKLPDKKKKADENPHKGHRDRLRDRFLAEGLSSFEDHNILELLLFYSIPQRDTNEIAHRLLSAFGGSLAAVFDATPEELMQRGKMSKNSAVLISLMTELFRAYTDDKKQRMSLEGRENIEEYVIQTLKTEYISEKIMVVCVDNRFRRVYDKIISEGSVNFAAIDKRKVAELAIRYNATAVIIAHNHPSGFAVPSNEDIETTIDLKRSLAGINVTLLDHIIVSPDDHISLASSDRYAPIFM